MADWIYLEQNYNLYLSDALPINRSLPDVRSLECQNLIFDNKLPNTSVIIIFHNEALPTILRSIRSIIDRSPVSLLKEIILVDDNSDVVFLGNVLNDIWQKHSSIPIEIVRSNERIGLIRARLLGAKQARVIFQKQIVLFFFLIKIYLYFFIGNYFNVFRCSDRMHSWMVRAPFESNIRRSVDDCLSINRSH